MLIIYAEQIKSEEKTFVVGMGDLIGDKHEHGFQRQNANYSLSKMNYIDQCIYRARSGPLSLALARIVTLYLLFDWCWKTLTLCVWLGFVRYSAWYHRCNKLARFLPSVKMCCTSIPCNRRMQFYTQLSAGHRFINRANNVKTRDNASWGTSRAALYTLSPQPTVTLAMATWFVLHHEV
jgi:hypothetical protein